MVQQIYWNTLSHVSSFTMKSKKLENYALIRNTKNWIYLEWIMPFMKLKFFQPVPQMFHFEKFLFCSGEKLELS